MNWNLKSCTPTQGRIRNTVNNFLLTKIQWNVLIFFLKNCTFWLFSISDDPIKSSIHHPSTYSTCTHTIY